MVLRNLNPRARPFRYAGYLSFALVLLALLPTSRPAWQLELAVGCCLLWPLGADLAGRRGNSPAHSVRLNLRLHLLECFATGSLVGWLSLPPLPTATVATAVLAGNAAQAGWWLAWRGTALFAVGALTGLAATPSLVGASTVLADLLSGGMLLLYSVGLGLTSFTKAQHLHRAQNDLQRRALLLDRLNQRLSRYLPGQVHARIQRQPDQPCGLERRWLTVAFVDVVGFTDLATRLAPEELAVILNDYFSVTTRHFDAAGGTVARLLGDGVLIYFGDAVGVPRQRAAVDCVESCRQVAALLEELAACWHRQGYLVTLATRVGIASGYCTLGDWGDERLDFTVIGSPVNLASRLQVRARENRVLICEATAALVQGALPLDPGRELAIRGFGPAMVYESVDGLERAGPSAKVPRPTP